MKDTTHTNRARLDKIDCLIQGIMQLDAAKEHCSTDVLRMRIESLSVLALETSSSNNALHEFLDHRLALDADPTE